MASAAFSVHGIQFGFTDDERAHIHPVIVMDIILLLVGVFIMGWFK